MSQVIEDYQAWEAYPDYRWVFNKLELSLRLGYHAGPAGIPVDKTGWYIVRPVYNPYGMGIGAHKKWLDVDWQDAMSDHKHIPPGYFWCEWFEGAHYSIDYRRGKNWKGTHSDWIPLNATQGFHYNDDNLTKFQSWRIIEPPHIDLPQWVHDIDVEELNVEFKADKITEIHLRSGNDIALLGNIGTEFYPIWQGDDYKHLEHLEFVPNLDEDEDYSADGNLKDIRLGYYKK
jgi:hypothetical protein